LHEASYALTIVDTVMEALKKEGLENVKVTKVIIKIGELSLVDPVALRNAFEAYSLGSPLEGAELEIEVVPSKFVCKRCGHEWTFKDVYPELKANIPVIHLYPHLVKDLLKCPKCNSSEVEIVQGTEFVIEGFEYQESNE